MSITSRSLATFALACCGLGLVAGCGGGASAKPEIVYKSSGSDQAGGNGSAVPVAAIDGTGTFTGTVQLTGTAPPPDVIVAKGTAKRDGEVCAATVAIVDQSLEIGESNGIANIFIFLDKAPPGAQVPAVPTEPAVFDQKGCVFIPHAMVTRTNQQVLVKSGDAIGHNTHTFPKRSRVFNQLIQANDRKGFKLKYNRAEREPFPVKCDMHSWMQAYHLAIDHPWGTTTNAKGEFKIEGVPATSLTFRVWHERAGGKGGFLERALKITVKKDETVTQDLKFALSDFGQ